MVMFPSESVAVVVRVILDPALNDPKKKSVVSIEISGGLLPIQIVKLSSAVFPSVSVATTQRLFSPKLRLRFKKLKLLSADVIIIVPSKYRSTE